MGSSIAVPVVEEEPQNREWRKTKHLRDDSGNSKQKSNNAAISRRATTSDPAKRDDADGLDVADYCTAHSASFVDDEELGYVDGACTEPTLQAR